MISAGPEGDRSMATVFIDNIYFYGTADTSNDSSGGSSDDSYCEKTVTHFGIAAETASAIKLSIAKQSQNSMKVTIESADNDPVDELIVNNSNGPITGEPQVSAKDDSVSGKLSITLTWPNNVPDNVTLNALWSKSSNPGNWQLSQQDITIPFNSSCGDSSGNDSQDQGGDNNASSDPAFTGSFGNATYDAGTNLYTFPSGAEAWAGFANENNTLYPFTFQYGGKITFNAATQGTDVEMNFKFEKNPHPDVDPSFSTSNITITGTDVLDNAQTEALTMANADVATSTKTFKTVTAITVSGAGTVGTLEVGVIESGLISVVCRSLFNEYPLGQSATTTGSDKNLANNIVIPKFSRINDIRFVVNEAFDTAGFDVQIGANVAQANGSMTNSHDLDYFAGDSDNDVRTVASHHIPTGMDQTVAQMKNCLNVSDDDASGYEMDKAVIITAKTDDALTTGEAVLNVYWTQQINNTN